MAAALLITVSYCGFVSWCWFGTYYEINGSQLKVVGGPFRWKIDIMGIKGVRKSRNLLSSPALSLDRLEVTYEKWGMILISPKKQEKFCETLKKINPNIEVNLNK
ncbi:PH domain-containing protein [Neobacillus muris]|uniref:PH domain-containing protein n=1 Tax=Neobacillus muris TaxID=2941334 RepID=UPI002041DAB7|nr:PH domain-containing protein [Neobacillus muris]